MKSWLLPFCDSTTPSFEQFSNQFMTTVRLSNCFLDDDDVSGIIKALFNNNLQLQRLLLDGNRCSSKSLNSLSLLLQQKEILLLELDISHQESDVAAAAGAPSLVSLVCELIYKTTLKSLRMRNNSLTDNNLHDISDMLCRNSTIIDVDLRFNAFTCHGIKTVLCDDLPRYKGLRRLQIRTGLGVMRKDVLGALIQGMEHNWTLRSLDLFDWERDLQHWLDLNRSRRLVLRVGFSFPLSLWPLVLERATRIVDLYAAGQFREKTFHRENLADRKAGILFYFPRNSPELIRS